MSRALPIGCSSRSAGSSSMPIRASSSAFGSACDLGLVEDERKRGRVARIASVTSSRRMAGRQCMNFVPALAWRPELLVHLIRPQDAAQLLLLVFRLHPPPADREDDVGLGDRLDWVVGEGEGGAALLAVGARERLRLARDLLLRRRRHDHVAAEARHGERHRGAHGVGALTDEGAGEIVHRAEVLENRQGVGHRLQAGWS